VCCSFVDENLKRKLPMDMKILRKIYTTAIANELNKKNETKEKITVLKIVLED
jgi:hypothetical protein